MKRMLAESDDAFELALLRSAKMDAAPSDSAEKAALALGATLTVAIAVSAASSTAAASGTSKGAAAAGKLGAIAVWKWIGLGIIVGSTVTMGTEHVVRHADPASNPSHREGQGEGTIAPTRAEAIAPPPPAAVAIPEIIEPAPVAALASTPSARPARVEAPPPSAAAISAEIAAISAPPVASASAPAVTIAAPNASALATEVVALDRARRALAAKDPAEAIRLLDVYERDVPVRVLGPEAQVLRIEAVAARGDRAEAKRLGEQFLLVYPRDPHADRVRRLLATMSNL